MGNYLEESHDDSSHIGAWIMAIIGVIYAISPVDIIPDVVPVAGWVDDLVITGGAILNLLEKTCGETLSGLAAIIKILKWILIVVGVIAILLILLLGGLIVKLFT